MGEDPIPLGQALDAAAGRFGMPAARDVGRIFSAWGEIVGPAVADHVEPIALRDGVLRLRADSPTWATEITYLREQIRGQVNEALGRTVVERIDVTAGPRRPRARHARERAVEPRDASPDTRGPRETVDPMTAFERAFAAWQRRRARRS